ncbi:MAG: hypothetical protein AAF745_02595 [Planctomycetota bacterium]
MTAFFVYLKGLRVVEKRISAVRLERDTENEPTYNVMRREEIKRDGRVEEFNRIKRVMLEEFPGLTPHQIHKKVFERMGLGDNLGVLRRYREHLNRMNDRLEEEKALDEMKRSEELAIRDEFERVFCGLPDHASRQVEWKWIENHPAMVLHRDADEDGMIQLTVRDIEDAPSRSAVGQLRHWVNKKDEFYKSLMSAVGKKSSGKDGNGLSGAVGGGSVTDPGLVEVEAMLDQIGEMAG